MVDYLVKYHREQVQVHVEEGALISAVLEQASEEMRLPPNDRISHVEGVLDGGHYDLTDVAPGPDDYILNVIDK